MIQKPTESQNAETSEFIKTWSELDTVWGHVAPLNGMDKFQAEAAGSEVNSTLTIRHRNDVYPDCRVLVPGYSTTLGAAVATTNVTAVTLAAAAPIPGRLDAQADDAELKVNDELMTMTAGFNTTAVTVTRAAHSSTPTTHANGDTVQVMRVFEVKAVRSPDESREVLVLDCRERW